MAKLPLFDPLGIPISLEWDSVESVIQSGAQALGQGVKEFASATIETSKSISGKGLDMNDSLVGFQEGKAKSTELMEKDKTASELRRKRMFFSSLTESLRNAQNFAHTPEIDELTVEAASMGTEPRNKLLGFNLNLKRDHTNNAASIAWTRRKLIEAQNQIKDKKQDAAIVPQVQGGFVMGENELLKGGESKTHWSNNPG